MQTTKQAIGKLTVVARNYFSLLLWFVVRRGIKFSKLISKWFMISISLPLSLVFHKSDSWWKFKVSETRNDEIGFLSNSKGSSRKDKGTNGLKRAWMYKTYNFVNNLKTFLHLFLLCFKVFCSSFHFYIYIIQKWLFWSHTYIHKWLLPLKLKLLKVFLFRLVALIIRWTMAAVLKLGPV